MHCVHIVTIRFTDQCCVWFCSTEVDTGYGYGGYPEGMPMNGMPMEGDMIDDYPPSMPYQYNEPY